MWENKKILIGISGSIAAYKIATLTRLLVKKGAEVKILMTEAATHFITPLTLATLSKNPVLTDFVKDNTGTWNNHVELGLWADLFIVAPATAHTLAQCAHGLADNLLIATYLSARCPVWFAPAMDLDMYQHPSTRNNIALLQQYGNHIIPAEKGELASGLSGEGRMAEPEHIIAHLEAFYTPTLHTKNVLLTVGPTQEAIDPVRFISNHSTGKMGIAIAETLLQQGAKVTLIKGALTLPIPTHPNLTIISVTSAQEMYEAAQANFQKADWIILSAAVADFTPAQKATQKIKKEPNQTTLTIHLTKTIDIAATLGAQKQKHQKMVGFALETHNELENAQKKLTSKNLDLIVLNSMQDAGAGFGHDTNKITIITAHQTPQHLPLMSKKEAAKHIVEAIKILDTDS